MASEIPNSGVYYYLDKDFSASSTGTVYYVSDCQWGADSNCVVGKDSNKGTSPSSPWRTCSKLIAQYNLLRAGDTILVAKGSILDCGSLKAGSNWVFNTNCKGTNPCVIDSYTPPWASGDEGQPVLHNLQLFFEDSGNADHDEGYVVRNVELRGDSLGADTWGVFFYNDVDYVLLENLRISGYGIGVYCGDSNSPQPPNTDVLNEHITLRNSTVTNNSSMGYLGGCPDFLIQNNVFDNNGFSTAMLNHNIYLSSQTGSHDFVVWGNTLRRSAVVNGLCTSASLVAHGQWSNLLIGYNRVEEDLGAAEARCWGISVDPGYGTAENFRGTVIRGNQVVNVGNVGIGATSCPDCVIENNVVINEQSTGAFGISIPDRERGSEDTPDNNITIRNNSIYLGSQVRGGAGITITREGSSHLVVSNVIQYAGKSPDWGCVQTTGLTKSSFEAFGYNLCYFSNSRGRWEVTAGASSNWKSATSLDSHSLVADPLFTSLLRGPNYSLVLQSGSPAVNGGHPTLSSTSDILRTKRDTKPDIGAYEFTQ
jgi:Right handed beta helix region